MSVYALFVLNDSLNEGDLVLHMCVSVCLCDLCGCVCVSRAISGVGFFCVGFFLFTTFFFNFLLCFIYGACLLYLVG